MGARFEITLRGGDDMGAIRRYTPGDTISGTVLVVPDSALHCNRVLIQLGWHTEGRGDRDEQIVAETDVARGTLAANVPLLFDFSFSLPNDPWSYAGHYVSIVWHIAAKIDISMAVDPRHEQPFILAPVHDQTSAPVWSVR